MIVESERGREDTQSHEVPANLEAHLNLWSADEPRE